MMVYFVGSGPATGFWCEDCPDTGWALDFIDRHTAEDKRWRQHEGEPYPAIFIEHEDYDARGEALKLWRERTGSNEYTFPLGLCGGFYVGESQPIEETR